MRRFARSALTSIGTTSLDFLVLIALVELAGVGYAPATFIGSLVGSTSNFIINRAWAFEATADRAHRQAARYVLTQLGSAGLHTLGVWALTRVCVGYAIAKVVVAVAAYLVWNYPLNRWYVFAPAKP